MVTLGFAEPLCESERYRFSRCFFPSKVGGAPVWLIPTAKVPRVCKLCKASMRFLLQMYSPGDSIDAFHRTVYIFLCSSKNGCTEPPLVVRQQLPVTNAFYPEDPPSSYEDPNEAIEFERRFQSPTMCAFCGYPGKNRCAKCRNTFYCSKDCQLAHWKNGHKKRCNPRIPDTVPSNFLFDEYDLVSEEFDDKEIETAKEFEEDDGAEIIDFDAAQAEADGIKQTFKNEDEPELRDNQKEDAEELVQELSDEKFQRWVGYFKEEPEQVVRYRRGGQYLTPKGWKNCDFGKCEICKSEREFEFQLTPYLFTLCQVEEDIATILVAVCKNDCKTSVDGFVREYAVSICNEK